MIKRWQKLLSEGIFYSPESLSFYRAFYAGMGMADIRELPSSMNNFLHRIVDMKAVTMGKKIIGGCVGRYRDDYESDEAAFDFEGYFTELIEVEINATDDGSAPDVCYVSTSKRMSKALIVAARSHSKQFRKSDGSPYINHLIEVMDLLTNFGDVADEDIVLGGILHDVLEDTNLKYSELLKGFGSRVANIVSALTDDKTQTLLVRRQQAINKIGTSPKSVKMIKLADACSNASAMPESWTKEKIVEYFIWLDQIALSCRDANEQLYLEYTSRRHTES